MLYAHFKFEHCARMTDATPYKYTNTHSDWQCERNLTSRKTHCPLLYIAPRQIIKRKILKIKTCPPYHHTFSRQVPYSLRVGVTVGLSVANSPTNSEWQNLSSFYSAAVWWEKFNTPLFCVWLFGQTSPTNKRMWTRNRLDWKIRCSVGTLEVHTH